MTLDAPRQGHSLPEVLSETETSYLITAVGSLDGPRRTRLAALVELLYAAGLRVSELVRLPLAAVVRDQPILTVRDKGEKERMVPLSDSARAMV